ncbi:hypothetical protein [Flavobacterium sp. RSSB_23]|uniref:hypothetical protein n=1 Tax=Flavobacterium sp. RSSB_23 TaxID=3447668 RepID=UPI003F41009E
MNVIQIQDLINKIGEFNQSNVLKEYSDGGEELLESQLKIIQDSNDELNYKILIQLKEKCDVELLQKFINLINTNGENLINLYHQYRRKLAESNNSNPIYIESIPIICKLIDAKLDVLTNLKSDLILKIANFDYRINTDFDYNTFSESNQKQEKETAVRATFNLSKRESLMLLYILEEINLLKFDNNAQRKNFIEQNFNFTEVRNNESYGKSFPITDIKSEYSRFNSIDKDELKSNNKTLENLSKKLITIIDEFKFEKKKNKT